jgi:hypothetical protein
MPMDGPAKRRFYPAYLGVKNGVQIIDIHRGHEGAIFVS